MITIRYQRWVPLVSQSLRGGEREASQGTRVQPQLQSSQVIWQIYFHQYEICIKCHFILKCVLMKWRFHVSFLAQKMYSRVFTVRIDWSRSLQILKILLTIVCVFKKIHNYNENYILLMSKKIPCTFNSETLKYLLKLMLLLHWRILQNCIFRGNIMLSCLFQS